MPEKKTVRSAAKKKKEGKSASTQAGEFVREEFRHIREGKHGARSTKQAIAIGLSKAREAGVDLPPQKKKSGTKAATKVSKSANASGGKKKVSAKRSKATTAALKREPKSAASSKSISAQSKKSAKARGATSRHLAAKKSARTRAKRAA